MNVLKRELKTSLKPFVFWVIGLFSFVFIGLTKFSGIKNTDVEMVMSLLETYPKIVLAIFGIPSGIDITSLSGYYFVLNNYAIILISLFAISFGVKAVIRETQDKTYEFLFTKPVSRNYILTLKIFSGLFYLIIYSILNYIFSISAVNFLGFENSINNVINTYCIFSFIISIFFFFLAVCISAIVKNNNKASLYSNFTFLFAFAMAITYDSVENTKYIKPFSPLRYISFEQINNNDINYIYIAILIICILISALLSYKFFNNKDLT